MKRLLICVAIIAALLMCPSCRGGRQMDVWIFIKSFNDLTETVSFDPAEVRTYDNGDGRTIHEFFSGDDSSGLILLTLLSDIDGTVKRCEITACKEGEYPFDIFLCAASVATQALTLLSMEEAEQILTALSAKKYAERSLQSSSYHDTLRYNYSLVSNSEAISFTVESSDMSPSESLTIRSTAKYSAYSD